MMSDQVKKIVIEQIGDDWNHTNLHGINLRRCIVPPQRIVAVNAWDEQNAEVWLVLLENPESRLGYGVVYHETSEEFGLVQFTEGHSPCLLGLYGSFFDALDGM